MAKRLLAELIGTFFLVFVAVGSAVFGHDLLGAPGIALAFGLVLMGLVYTIGPISGCHVNPAVTVGVLLDKGISAVEAGLYVVVQVVGAILGAALLTFMTTVGHVHDQTPGLGTNTYGEHVSGPGAFVVEIVLTFLLVFVVLRVTSSDAPAGFAGLAIGATLAAIHLAAIPLDSTSVNPARSIGPALFNGGQALGQLWLFIVAPLIGGVLAAVVAKVFRTRAHPQQEESRQGEGETG